MTTTVTTMTATTQAEYEYELYHARTIVILHTIPYQTIPYDTRTDNALKGSILALLVRVCVTH